MTVARWGRSLTRGVWQQIVAGNCVAQELISLGERMIRHDDTNEPRKTDIRLFTTTDAFCWQRRGYIALY